ncbi:MAG: TIGR04086 family membrane protein [Clostridia bacterium]|nr:TIGR04086 family membrane protein [Clostridia bacterium]
MSSNNESILSNSLKGTLLAVLFALSGVLVFAVVLKIFSLSPSVVKPVNQVIKVLSVFGGVMLCVRGKTGFLKGFLIGVCSIILTYLLFALMGGEKLFSVGFLLDIVFGAVAGVISGIVSVNLKKPS